MRKVGFEMVGGEALSTSRHGTKGGVAVLTKIHLQSRVILQWKGAVVSLLLLSLYLKNSTPLPCHPNAEILARLVAVIKHHSGQWLVAGDFNLSPQEVAGTALVSELGGQLHTVGFPTTHGASELDFAITSSAIAGLISVALDWSAPHRPHASLCIEFLIPGKQDKALRLLDFPTFSDPTASSKSHTYTGMRSDSGASHPPMLSSIFAQLGCSHALWIKLDS